MSTSVPSKPPSRKPISFFVAKGSSTPAGIAPAGAIPKPTETEPKEDKQFTLRLKAVMDNVFEPRAANSNPLGIPDKSQMEDSFQNVKYKETARKTQSKVIDYSKDLSDHELESEKSD